MLQGGDLENVDRTTITQITPDTLAVTIEQGQQQDFFVVAKAPAARIVSYAWTLDSATVQAGASASYSITGSLANTGDHTLIVIATDGVTSDSKSWSVRVNGPPTITAITTGTPKVSVGSQISILANASDPNADTLTYTWTLNGATSPFLTGTTGTATLTGDDSIAGAINITLTVSDGTATDTYTWPAEVNYFPMACNQLSQGQICTYAGSPSVGDGENPAVSQKAIRTSMTGVTADELGNYIFADPLNNLVWYWNQSATAITKYGITIPANSLKVIVGTGEPANGADSVPGLDCALSAPQDVYYLASSQTLFIADRGNNVVRFVNSSTGIVSKGLGGGASNVNGVSVYTAACNQPYDIYYYSGDNSLYAACYGTRIVKRWDLSTDTAYNVMGNGTAGCGGDGGAALSNNLTNPFGVFVDSNGVYIADYGCHKVRFVNNSGAALDFYGGTAPASIANGLVTTVLGTGAASYSDVAQDPLAMPIGNPTSVFVSGGMLYVSVEWSNRDRIIVANNSGSSASIGSTTVNNAKAIRVTSATTEGYNGSGISLNSARLYNPRSISLDPLDASRILIGDYSNLRMRVIDTGTWEISDFMGSGRARYGFVGDTEKPTTEQYFQNPKGVAFDSVDRKLFFIDSSNGRIRQVDAYGRASTALGRGISTPVTENEIPSNVYTQFNGGSDTPGLALFDDNSLLYVDRYIFRVWNRLVTSFSYANIFIQNDSVSSVLGYAGLTTAGNSIDTTADSMLTNNPGGVSIYGTGAGRIIFYADTTNHCVRSIDDAGMVDTIVGNVNGSNDCLGTTGNGNNVTSNPMGYGLSSPSDVAVDSNGNLFIADRDNHKIRFLNRSASPVTVGTVTINPGQIATVACNSGSTGSASDGVYATSARCNSPRGIAVNGSYFCFSNNGYNDVRCVNMTGASAGKIYTVAGADVSTAVAGSPFGFEQEGIAGTSARLYSPRSIAFDSSGDLYISDTNNHIIRKLKLSP